MKLSIVIPVLNEEAVIRTTHNRVVALLGKLQEKGVINEYEILYVDDGSCDGTFKILQELSADSPNLKVLSFTRNFGHQPALVAGITHSSGDVVASLDADLQDPPELIEEMINKYLQGNDIVYAVRNTRPTDSKFKRGTAMLFYRLMGSMGVDIIYAHADYRLISRRVVEVFRSFREVNLFLRGIFPYLGFPYTTVTYTREERFAGEDEISPEKDDPVCVGGHHVIQ